MKIQRLFAIVLFMALILRGGLAHAQEFNFTVKVVNPQVRLADPKVFVSLENAVKELINGTKWTDDIFEQNERLTGSIQLTIDKENSQTSFTAKLAIQVNRPVYGSDATTPLFIHLDKEVSFSYEQFQPLQFVKNNFTENLSSTIGYYVYVILAMDYDSFSPQGGEMFWQAAQDIYNIIPEAAKGEWKGKDYPVRMFFEDDLIYILGTELNLKSGYCDCILYDEKFPTSYALYFPNFKPLDICYLPKLNAFFVLSGQSVWGVFISGDGATGFKKAYKDYQIATDATEIFRVGDKLITLGNELSVYAATENTMSLVKNYPGITGKCCKKEGNIITVANTQGLYIYDITDPENIKLIP